MTADKKIHKVSRDEAIYIINQFNPNLEPDK